MRIKSTDSTFVTIQHHQQHQTAVHQMADDVPIFLPTSSNLQQMQQPEEINDGPCSPALKFSHSTMLTATSVPVYPQYIDQSTSVVNQKTTDDVTSPVTSLTPVSIATNDIGGMAYNSNVYNSATLKTYSLPPPNICNSSNDCDLKFDTLYSSQNNSSTNQNLSQRRGSLQLWQFLVALLDEPTAK